MKTLQVIFGVSAAVVLMGLNVGLADMKNVSSNESLKFSLDFGDSAVTMPDLTFDMADGVSCEEAQTTCVMTPGGVTSALLLQTPIIPPVNNRPDDYRHGSSRPSPPPLYDQPPTPYSPSSNRGRNRNSYNPPIWGIPEVPEVPQTPADVPEPATLVIVGLGIGAVAVARRRWKNH